MTSGLDFTLPRLSVGNIVNPAIRAAELRRLDESIHDEQNLLSRTTMLQAEVGRVQHEIDLIGRPAGVTSAIVILSIYSVFGIVTPVIVMALGLKTLTAWLEWLLVALFVAGLSAVLGLHPLVCQDPERPCLIRPRLRAGEESW